MFLKFANFPLSMDPTTNLKLKKIFGYKNIACTENPYYQFTTFCYNGFIVITAVYFGAKLLLTLSPPNKLLSAKFLVCFNFESATRLLKVDEIVV